MLIRRRAQGSGDGIGNVLDQCRKGLHDGKVHRSRESAQVPNVPGHLNPFRTAIRDIKSVRENHRGPAMNTQEVIHIRELVSGGL